MTPWYKVVTPRKDLREGKPLDASEFAIHLDQVVAGEAAEDYAKPAKFLERTYLTGGLLDLVAEVARRLSGEAVGTSPVINLTTPFGGGKTHALTLLYHLFSHGPAAAKWSGVDDILKKADLEKLPRATVAVFVGTGFDVLTGRTAKGEPHRKTPWGEMAWQIGGRKGYVLVAEHDGKMVAPGGDVIRALLPKEPVLILMDEVMNYVARARGVTVGESSLPSQFIQFIHILTTEAAQLGRPACVVGSLPASEQEMTPEDEGDYGRLKKLFTRVEKAYVLAEGPEMAEIIRRRLFEDLGPEKTRRAVAKEMAAWVREHRTQLPMWFAVDRAEEVFEATYPFHPSCLSVFERKWQALSKFQRTRGMLRLLALWVSKAYTKAFASAFPDPLITLGSAPLDDGQFRAATLEQLGEDRLDPAVLSDIAGPKAHAVRLDEESPGTAKSFRIHRRAASAILFESSGGQIKQEATLPEVRLAVGGPEFEVGEIETAVEELVRAAYFISVEGTAYKVSIRENLTKRHADRRATVPDVEVQDRMEEEVRKVFVNGPPVDRIFFPREAGAVPDAKALTLVILPPGRSWEEGERRETKMFLDTLFREHGESARVCRNALVAAVPESSAKVRDAVRGLLAWEKLDEERESLGLDDTQLRQLTEQRHRAERDVREAIWRMYHHVGLAGEDGAVHVDDLGHSLPGAAESLTGLILARLRQKGEVEDEVGPRYLVQRWPGKAADWSTSALLNAFFSSPKFVRVREPGVIKRAIVAGASQGVFGYATKTSEGRYEDLVMGETLTEMAIEFAPNVVLVKKEIAQAQKAGKPVVEPVAAGGLEAAPTRTSPEESPNTAAQTRAGWLKWEGVVPAGRWAQFYTRVLSRFPLHALTLKVSVEAKPPEGVTDTQIREMKEALHDLGLDDQVRRGPEG